MNFEYVESRKGSYLVYFENYLFRKDRQYQNGDITYACRTHNCNIRGNLRGDCFFLTSSRSHAHPHDKATVDMMRRKKVAVESAVDQPTTSMKRLYSTAFASEEGDTDASVPAFKSVKSSMYRKRAERLPKQPQTLIDMKLDGEWLKTKSNSDFLQIDDGTEDRILVFFTVSNLRILASSKTYYMDGTFHVAARLFKQLYIIYASAFDTLIPVCYALLPDKLETTYKRLFELLKMKAHQYNIELSPEIIQIDFEKAVINAVSQIFPNSSIRGCYFHFTQAIWRGVQRYGLINEYKESESIGRLVRRALGLPFLPLSSIDDVWMRVIGECPPECQEFIDYVTSTYVDDVDAMFPREIWCHYSNESGIRTNNSLESRNAKFRQVSVYILMITMITVYSRLGVMFTQLDV